MNPRTTDAAESKTLYDLHHRYQDTWDKMVFHFAQDVLDEFVETVAQLAEDYQRQSFPLARPTRPVAPQVGAGNGAVVTPQERSS
jgi:acyl-CoA reductase-like NAD-dependent aldehyde dehydrogenase